MKCVVDKSYSGHYFFILIENNFLTISSEDDIAEYLGFEFYKYTELIVQNGGFLASNDFYYFRTEKECKVFIEKFIEPRLIMEKLIE